MAFCTSCGNSVSTKFCGSCGAEVVRDPAVRLSPPGASTRPSQSEAPETRADSGASSSGVARGPVAPKRGGGGGTLFIALGGLALIIVVYVVQGLITGHWTEDSRKNRHCIEAADGSKVCYDNDTGEQVCETPAGFDGVLNDTC